MNDKKLQRRSLLYIRKTPRTGRNDDDDDLYEIIVQYYYTDGKTIMRPTRDVIIRFNICDRARHCVHCKQNKPRY